MRTAQFAWTSTQIDGVTCLFEIDCTVRVEFSPVNTRDWMIVEVEFHDGLAIDANHKWWSLIETGLFHNAEAFECAVEDAIQHEIDEAA